MKICISLSKKIKDIFCPLTALLSNLFLGHSIFFKSTSTSLFTCCTFYQNLNNLHEYLIKHSLKSWGTKDHFKQVKVPGMAPYWKVCVLLLVIHCWIKIFAGNKEIWCLYCKTRNWWWYSIWFLVCKEENRTSWKTSPNR